MADPNTDDLEQNEVAEEAANQETEEPEAAPESGDADEETPAGSLREGSYIVLFIAAVFIISAMETGSYRTPWPVAIVTLLAGLGLFGYSWRQQS